MPGRGKYALDEKKIAWAWEKRKQGYTMDEVARALYVDYNTLRRTFRRVYGQTRPWKKPLVYEEK